MFDLLPGSDRYRATASCLKPNPGRPWGGGGGEVMSHDGVARSLATKDPHAEAVRENVVSHLTMFWPDACGSCLGVRCLMAAS